MAQVRAGSARRVGLAAAGRRLGRPIAGHAGAGGPGGGRHGRPLPRPRARAGSGLCRGGHRLRGPDRVRCCSSGTASTAATTRTPALARGTCTAAGSTRFRPTWGCCCCIALPAPTVLVTCWTPHSRSGRSGAAQRRDAGLDDRRLDEVREAPSAAGWSRPLALAPIVRPNPGSATNVTLTGPGSTVSCGCGWAPG